jgi:multidrug efflux pump subunit AcrA (membrane-fusion protein)
LGNLKEDLAALRIDQSERAHSGRTGLWIGLLILVLVTGAGAWYWSSSLQAASVKVAPVTTKSASAGPGAVLNASGYVTARRRATVSSKVTGKVVEIFIEEGQTVRAGQVLARLDDSQARAALALAEAQLGAARRSAAEDEARLREAELNLQRRERP